MSWFLKYAKNEKPVSHEESAKSILGMNPGETPLAVTKDMNGQVDAITASTITSRAFLNAVNAAYQAYKGGEVDTNSGASQKNEPAVAPEGEAAANYHEDSRRVGNDKFPWIRGKCDFPKNTTLLLLLF